MKSPFAICTKILDVFVITVAVFTLYSHIFVLLNKNFVDLVGLIFVPLVIALLICYFFVIDYSDIDSSCWSQRLSSSGKVWDGSGKMYISSIILSIIIAFIYIRIDSYALFYILSLSYLLAISYYYPLQKKPHVCVEDGSRNEGLVILAFVILACVVTLISHRQDADDAFYLGTIISILENPDQPLFVYDGMHGEDNLPYLAGFYRIQSLGVLVATVSQLLHLSPLLVYYIIFPALLSGLVVIAHYLALVQVVGDRSIFGLLLILIVLVCWGDGHRVFGNFAFVRLFQGKSILVSIIMPAIFFYSLKYVNTQKPKDLIMLGFTQVAAVGASSSGLIAAPLAAFLVLLAAWGATKKKTLMLFKGLFSFVFLLVPFLIILNGTGVNPFSENPTVASGHFMSDLVATGKPDGATENSSPPFFSYVHDGLAKVVGNGTRGCLAVLCLLLCFSLCREGATQNYAIIGRYILLIFVIVLNPITPFLFGHSIAPNFSWRIFWAIPFPLIIGITGSLILTNRFHFNYNIKRLNVFLYVMLVVLFVVTGQWTLSSNNRTEIRYPSKKIHVDQYEIAEFIVQKTPEAGIVYAPWEISWVVALFSGHPRLIAVRPHYLHLLQYKYGPEEVRIRQIMMAYVAGAQGAEKLSPNIIRLIKEKEISTVVFDKNLPWRGWLSENLQPLGYRLYDKGNYQVWVRQ